MKGFYIYENDVFPKKTDCLSLYDVSHVCKLSGWADPEVTIDAGITKKTYTQCNKKDKYDFEIGSLISLMKMCGKAKTEKAYLETFFKGGDPGDCPYYQVCKEPTIRRLEGEVEQLKLDNEKLQKGYSLPKLSTREKFWAEFLYLDTDGSKWAKIPVYLIDDFEHNVKARKPECIGFFMHRSVMWKVIKEQKLDYIWVKLGSSGKYIIYCTEIPYERCEYLEYIPYTKFEFFKRGKFYIRLYPGDWSRFRDWCGFHGVEWNLLPERFKIADSGVIFKFNRKLYDIEMGFPRHKDVPTYNWRDMCDQR